MSQVAFALFCQLRELGRPLPGGPGFQDEEGQEKCRRVLKRIEAIFGLNEGPYAVPTALQACQGMPQPGRVQVAGGMHQGAPEIGPAQADFQDDSTQQCITSHIRLAGAGIANEVPSPKNGGGI
jgi:hypothetical protein